MLLLSTYTGIWRQDHIDTHNEIVCLSFSLVPRWQMADGTHKSHNCHTEIIWPELLVIGLEDAVNSPILVYTWQSLFSACTIGPTVAEVWFNTVGLRSLGLLLWYLGTIHSLVYKAGPACRTCFCLMRTSPTSMLYAIGPSLWVIKKRLF